jgi:hypothetical protein
LFKDVEKIKNRTIYCFKRFMKNNEYQVFFYIYTHVLYKFYFLKYFFFQNFSFLQNKLILFWIFLILFWIIKIEWNECFSYMRENNLNQSSWWYGKVMRKSQIMIIILSINNSVNEIGFWSKYFTLKHSCLVKWLFIFFKNIILFISFQLKL